jgi:hypothetical protein
LTDWNEDVTLIDDHVAPIRCSFGHVNDVTIHQPSRLLRHGTSDTLHQRTKPPRVKSLFTSDPPAECSRQSRRHDGDCQPDADEGAPQKTPQRFRIYRENAFAFPFVRRSSKHHKRCPHPCIGNHNRPRRQNARRQSKSWPINACEERDHVIEQPDLRLIEECPEVTDNKGRLKHVKTMIVVHKSSLNFLLIR